MVSLFYFFFISYTIGNRFIMIYHENQKSDDKCNSIYVNVHTCMNYNSEFYQYQMSRGTVFASKEFKRVIKRVFEQ